MEPLGTAPSEKNHQEPLGMRPLEKEPLVIAIESDTYSWRTGGQIGRAITDHDDTLVTVFLFEELHHSSFAILVAGRLVLVEAGIGAIRGERRFKISKR